MRKNQLRNVPKILQIVDKAFSLHTFSHASSRESNLSFTEYGETIHKTILTGANRTIEANKAEIIILSI